MTPRERNEALLADEEALLADEEALLADEEALLADEEALLADEARRNGAPGRRAHGRLASSAALSRRSSVRLRPPQHVLASPPGGRGRDIRHDRSIACKTRGL
jgi:hypothetical protein